MRTPSTRTSSCPMSAWVPSSRTSSPFKVTRPWRMTCSDPRREATPARARIFWSRSCTGRMISGRPGLLLVLDPQDHAHAVLVVHELQVERLALHAGGQVDRLV